MKRTMILIAVFLFSLSLVTLAYSQSDIKQTLNSAVTNSPTSSCPIGSQLSASVTAQKKPGYNKEACGMYNAYIQGICGCENGTLTRRNTDLCKQELQKSNIP
jgi:hypothetical protein